MLSDPGMPVALFPSVAPKKPVIRVEIKEGRDLRDSEWTPQLNPYVVCEIPGKPHSRFQTNLPLQGNNQRHPQDVAPIAPVQLEDYVLGETIKFTVWDRGTRGKDEFLGERRLMPGEFFPNGFPDSIRSRNRHDRGPEGWIELSRNGQGTGGLRIAVTVVDHAGGANRPALDVNIVQAKHLPRGSCYCVCRVPGRQHVKPIRTPTLSQTTAPDWNHTEALEDYVPGDPLEFIISDNNGELGRKQLQSDRFFPDGFNGILELESRNASGIKLKVKINVRDGESSASMA